MNYLQTLWQRLRALRLDASRMRSVGLYLFFVAISTVLWGFISFNNYMTKDLRLPLVVNKPSHITFLDSVPDTISVQVSSGGESFIKYLFVSAPTLTLDFNGTNGKYRVSAVEMRKKVKALFGSAVSVSNIWPESLSLAYTELQPVRVPIEIDVDLAIAPGYVPSGQIIVTPDSVDVYGTAELINNINRIYTRNISGLTNVNDTVRRCVALQHVDGVVVRPPTVDVVVPIEPLVEASSDVPVQLINAPANVKANFHPAQVSVKYKKPKSYDASMSSARIKTVVDYNTINLKYNRARVEVKEWPAAYENVVLITDSVTYTIERW